MEMVDESPVLSRREARRQDRRDAILAVASTSFLEQGYAGTTMSAIAATIGGSKATLWSYFPSKEALFEAVLEQATTSFRQQLIPLLDPCGDPERTLTSFCLRFVEKVTNQRAIALQRLVYGEAGRSPEVGQIFNERGPRTTQRLVGAFMGSLMERGELRRGDPEQAARLLCILCMAGCHNQMLLGLLEAPTPEMIAADVHRAMETFLRAYAP